MPLSALFKAWTKAEREKVPPEDFAGPNRTFPIETQDDLDSAAHLIGKAKDPEKVRARLISIAKRKGLKLPESWTTADHTDGAPSGPWLAEFAVDASGRRVDGGYAIYPNARLFQAGEYPDKAFSLSPEEMWLACEQFTPVTGNIQHTDYLKGRACEVRSIRLADGDPFALLGEVAVPLWLDENLEGHEKRLSCEWDRESKTLAGIALCVNPRVEDAALMTAEATFASKHQTSHGVQSLQEIHNASVRGGAVCKRPGSADMASSHEHTAIQQAHDISVEHGAMCDDMRAPRPYFGTSDSGGHAVTTPTPTPTKEGRTMSRFSEFMAYLKGEDEESDSDDQQKSASQAKPAAAPAAAPAQMSTPAESEALRAAKNQLAHFEQENRRLKMERIHQDAEHFVEKAIAEEYAMPKEREALMALRVQAAMDDSTLDVVKFEDGTETSRVKLLEDSVKQRVQGRLTKEQLNPELHKLFIASNPSTTAGRDGQPMSEERRKELLAMTEKGREVLAEKNGTRRN